MKRANLFLALAAGAMLVGCASGSMVRLQGSPQVPSAEGTVKTKLGDNKNTQVQVQVHHLARPERVSTGATVFVVWAKSLAQDGTAQNLGALRVDKDLNGELETVTPMSSFDLTVTAEPSATVPAPSGAQVLAARVGRM